MVHTVTVPWTEFSTQPWGAGGVDLVVGETQLLDAAKVGLPALHGRHTTLVFGGYVNRLILWASQIAQIGVTFFTVDRPYGIGAATGAADNLIAHARNTFPGELFLQQSYHTTGRGLSEK
jgi:hypothetical protein